jgi:hypothetical protein
LPLLANALDVMGDAQQFFVRQYRELGPIFRVGILNQSFTVMAGADANRFLRLSGRSCRPGTHVLVPDRGARADAGRCATARPRQADVVTAPLAPTMQAFFTVSVAMEKSPAVASESPHLAGGVLIGR